jgi:hypothetical protein
MIKKEKFCEYINYINFLTNLVDEDKKHKHIVSIMNFLHTFFPRDEDGFSEIEHHCLFLNFGKLAEDYESPEELYERLTNEK